MQARTLVLAIPLLTTALQAQTPTAPNFTELRTAWIQNLESRNLEASLALYAPDATFTNPDGTHATGPAIRDLYRTVFATFHSRIRMTPRAFAFSGDLAYEAGSYDEDLTLTANGTHNRYTGDFLTIFHRSPNGKWLIQEQVWTTAPPK